MIKERVFPAIYILFLCVACGCSVSEAANVTDVFSASTSTKPQYKDCIRSASEYKYYVVNDDSYGQPISPYNVYFYIDSTGDAATKQIRLIAKLNESVESKNGKPNIEGQLTPTWFEWHLIYAIGSTWYVGFRPDEDGVLSTQLTLSEKDWRVSSLCVYFEDINDDGIRDEVVFRVIVEDFVALSETPDDKIAAYLQAIIERDKDQALSLWKTNLPESNDKHQSLSERRQLVTEDLITAEISSEYYIGSLEGWGGGSEPGLKRLESASLVRVNVSLSSADGKNLRYVFDLLDQNYEGMTDYYVRDWVIVDVYPETEEPLYLRMISQHCDCDDDIYLDPWP